MYEQFPSSDSKEDSGEPVAIAKGSVDLQPLLQPTTESRVRGGVIGLFRVDDCHGFTVRVWNHVQLPIAPCTHPSLVRLPALACSCVTLHRVIVWHVRVCMCVCAGTGRRHDVV